ncbi:MAG TPA: FtsQ-type POTRA domain-containing protein [Actinomycetota bacterium]|nr:FtsQ-type POTRA domain-containing protein [Actinomycetota bacterium]
MGISTSRPAEWFRSLGRRRRMTLIAVGSVALVIGGVTASRSSAFDVRGIEVSGNDHLHRPQVVRIAGITDATNALWLDEGQAERRLEAEPWIADADVRVTFPLNVEIAVRERTPVALAQGAVTSLMAADGTALGSGNVPRGLPVIELGGAGRAEGVRPSPVGAARVLGAMTPALRVQVARVRVLLDGTLELRLRDGPTISFGTAGDARRKAVTIRRMLVWARTQGTPLRTLSVVAPLAPAATFIDPA